MEFFECTNLPWCRTRGCPAGLVLTDGPMSEDLPAAPSSARAAAVGLHAFARLQQQLGDATLFFLVPEVVFGLWGLGGSVGTVGFRNQSNT